MTGLQQLKHKILKQVADMACYDDWDDGYDAALRTVVEWIRKIEAEQADYESDARYDNDMLEMRMSDEDYYYEDLEAMERWSEDD